jgi:DNA-binding MarR family transcriptional regulator
MSRIIDGLEGRRRNNHDDATEHKERRGKLVERVDSTDDRRLVYARITPEGLQMLDYYCAKSEESVAAVLRRIEPSEMADLEQALNVLRCALESGS